MTHFTFVGSVKKFGLYTTPTERQLGRIGKTYPQLMKEVKDTTNRFLNYFSPEDAFQSAAKYIENKYGLPKYSLHMPSDEEMRLLELAKKLNYKGNDPTKAQEFLDNFIGEGLDDDLLDSEEEEVDVRGQIVPSPRGEMVYSPSDDSDDDMFSVGGQIVPYEEDSLSQLANSIKNSSLQVGDISSLLEGGDEDYLDVPFKDVTSSYVLEGKTEPKLLPRASISIPKRQLIDRNTLRRLQKMPFREAIRRYKELTGGLFNRNPKLVKI